MDSITPYQQTALQIANSGKEIASPQQLAELRLAKDAGGHHVFPRYRSLPQLQRIEWLGDQIFGLAILTHTTATFDAVSVDSTALDAEIMDNPILSDLTLIEMQEAFKKGITKAYGDYFGLSYASLLQFLNGFLRSEKKMSATAIVQRHYAKLEQERDAKFFRELYEAEKAGKITLPDFSHMRINGPQGKKVYTPEESAAHREKVRRQAEEILRQQKQAENGTQEEPQQ